MRRVVIVNDKMQQGYRYELSASVGRDFDPQFRPDLNPKQMLELGVFCGKYLTDCRDEYPARWFARAKFSTSGRDCSLNYFGVDASQPLSEWRRKGWMHADDPRGVLCVKFCKGGHGWVESCGLAELNFLVLFEIVHIEVAVGFEPVLVGLDG